MVEFNNFMARFIPTKEFAISVARYSLALFFAAHAIVRIANNTIPQFGNFMGSLGFPYPIAWVWGITIVEIICATLLVIRQQVILACIGLSSIAIGGIVLIHFKLGWFVGEHGTGGMEYSVALIIISLLVASGERKED